MYINYYQLLVCTPFMISKCVYRDFDVTFVLFFFHLFMVSKKLREAMGLEDHMIPSYVLRMKEVGYPPGWKLFKQEGLKMFVGEGVGKYGWLMGYFSWVICTNNHCALLHCTDQPDLQSLGSI